MVHDFRVHRSSRIHHRQPDNDNSADCTSHFSGRDHERLTASGSANANSGGRRPSVRRVRRHGCGSVVQRRPAAGYAVSVSGHLQFLISPRQTRACSTAMPPPQVDLHLAGLATMVGLRAAVDPLARSGGGHPPAAPVPSTTATNHRRRLRATNWPGFEAAIASLRRGMPSSSSRRRTLQAAGAIDVVVSTGDAAGPAVVERHLGEPGIGGPWSLPRSPSDSASTPPTPAVHSWLLPRRSRDPHPRNVCRRRRRSTTTS